MSVVYAAGALALLTGGLDLWLAREAARGFAPGGAFWLALTVLLCCIALRWTWASGDPAVLRGRTGAAGAFAIATGLLLLVTFELWRTLAALAAR